MILLLIKNKFSKLTHEYCKFNYMRNFVKVDMFKNLDLNIFSIRFRYITICISISTFYNPGILKKNIMNNSVSTMSGKTKLKIVLLGNQSVGKSSIIEKYVKDVFD